MSLATLTLLGSIGSRGCQGPLDVGSGSGQAFRSGRVLRRPPHLLGLKVPQYFADGITDDLTTDLSRISDSFFIAHNTARTYKGKPVDAKQVGRELGVRYVLEGSVRRAGDQVQVNAQLIDAVSGAHLWRTGSTPIAATSRKLRMRSPGVSRGHSTSS
jgi:hypothetical protein